MTRGERADFIGCLPFPDGTPPQIARGKVNGQAGVWLWSMVEEPDNTKGLAFFVTKETEAGEFYGTEIEGPAAVRAHGKVKPSMTLDELRKLHMVPFDLFHLPVTK